MCVTAVLKGGGGVKTGELAGMPDFELVVRGEEKEIETVYCADLLSWAMSRAPADSAWCTVMGNVNAVAVASLADVAVLVLCEGAVLDEDAKSKAEEKGINIAKTTLSAFDAGVKIAKAAKILPE